jgi:KaiC/GvpD/RAD55 family RecA-like ATPase
MMVSMFKTATHTVPADVSHDTILKRIQDGKWSGKIMSLRGMSKEEYKEAKKNLPAVTFSGTFSERLASKIIKYSGMVILDIDNIDEVVIMKLKSQFKEDPYVYAAFTSPSGKGIKILVKVNNGPEHHKSAFLHLQKVFEDKYCMKIDDSGKDVCRLCFVSFDPNMYLNEGSSVFEVDIRYGEVKSYVQPAALENVASTKDSEKIFRLCESWVNRTMVYAEGSRNRYVHALACAMNRCGVVQETTLSLCANKFTDLTVEETTQCVKNAYYHNVHEHGSVEVKDIGSKEFMPPAYNQNFSDDVVLDDIMRMTSLLYAHGVSNEESYNIMKKIGAFYQAKGFISFKGKSLGKIMNEAVELYKKKEADGLNDVKLNYVNAEDILASIIGSDLSGNPTTFENIDIAMGGGKKRGNFYGVIGVGGTFKSVLSQFLAFVSALNGKPVLYLNGEMSTMQWYERLSLLAMAINLQQAIKTGQISKDNMGDFIKEMNKVLDNNLLFVNGSGFNEENVIATIKHIEAKTGKKIEEVYIDGVTQMDQYGMDEIRATIENTRACKEIAKKGDVCVIGLLHISGQPDKLKRDSGPVCRGGVKTVANMDGYFSTSLLASMENLSPDKISDDIIYTEKKFYLKFVDKRGNGGVVDAIIEVDDTLRLRVESYEAYKYEVKLQ